MNTAERAPWLSQYDEALPLRLKVPYLDALSLFRAAVDRAPEAPLIHYLDATLSAEEIDKMSDALACALADRGVGHGDRVGVYLQNIPQFPISMVAIWKVGAMMVSLNPMNKAQELRFLLNDSGVSVLICLESLYAEVAASVIAETPVRMVITTSELEFVSHPDVPMLASVTRTRGDRTEDMLTLVEQYRSRRPATVHFAPTDVAFLTYTSGTTGPPKGAMNTHGNVVFTAEAYRRWISLDHRDSILGIAPLFHITGLIAHIALSFSASAPLVLGYRFDAEVMLDLIERYRPTFTIGSITAFVALMNAPTIEKRDLSSLSTVYSGGQPVPAAIVEEFERKVGPYIHIAYGLTETTSPSHLVPIRKRAPVDPTSGSLSVGVPIFDTVATIVDEDGAELAVGEVGEIVIAGPQVVPGYWQKPEETAMTFPKGAMRTGDVGFMNEDGWFFVVDRKKDLINVSGYKVWPREVEDILYQHPSVREAAVIGVPDDYRGETVKAFVSLKVGTQARPEELREFCKERLAAYKYPRDVIIIDELPKTVSGKILRRELRSMASPEERRFV